MPRAFNMVRHEPHYRREAIVAGCEALGYEVHGVPRDPPRRGDILIIWNRYGHWDRAATQFERAGCRVICCENGLLGRDWRTRNHWYSLALGHPAVSGGQFREGGPERWANWGVEFCEWRKTGKEVIVLAQRSIGAPGHAQPAGWHVTIAQRLRTMTRLPVRIRPHPGELPAVPVEEDIRDAYCCVTWGSGAGIKALIAGVPVFFGNPKWIGAGAAQMLGNSIDYPYLHGREKTFERLAWSTWNTNEIATGEPFRSLLAL